MQTRPFVILLAAVLVGAPAFADPTAPASAARVSAQAPRFSTVQLRYAKLFAPMKKEARLKVEAAGRGLVFELAAQPQTRAPVRGAKPFDLVSAARAQVAGNANFGLGEGADIEALAFIVLMQATKDADADLEAIMAAVRAVDKAKAAFRDGPEAMKRAISTENLRASDIDEIKSKIKDSIDSMSELGETESLRLQMAMDRLSKFMQALSNLMKKDDNATQAVVQNMK